MTLGGADAVPVPVSGGSARRPLFNANQPPLNGSESNLVTLIVRAINLTAVDPSANSAIAYAVENQIKASSLVDPKATQLVGQITTDEATGTFTFTVTVALLKPVNF